MLTKLPKMTKIAIFLLFCLRNLLFRCGDIEANPGPKYSSLTFCHWNLNGLTAHDSIKISLLQAYITQHNYDIICLWETFLNSSIEPNNDRILVDRYNLITADHPSNSKRGGVCVYYKEHIPLIKRDGIYTLDNCSAGQEIDSCTLSVGYKHIIDKPTHVVNNSMSWIDLLFYTNQNTISNFRRWKS